MKEVVIVSAVRTPIGAFLGSLSSVTAVELGTIVAKEAIKRANINTEDIEEVFFGNVIQAGLGQNPARQIAVNAGIPYAVGATTTNILCGSGLKATIQGAQAILCGDRDVVLVGGTESMSNAPYISKTARTGAKMGQTVLLDTLLSDGLTDAFHNIHMGVTAENIAKEKNISRVEQDEFAVASQNRAEEAIKSGRFKDEIVPVEIKQKRGESKFISEDEFPRFGTTLETLGKLRPAFVKDDGTVTAGNASGINDGAAALVLMSKEKADKLNIKYLATIKSYDTAGVKPETMGYGPIPASINALKKANMEVSDIDLVELNEAFAAQSMAVIDELKLSTDIVNVNGGAIALGHPIGCSGARIIVTLLHEMEKRNLKTGLASLCVGGGQGVAIIVEK